MSFSSNNSFYNSQNFDSYSNNNKSLLTNDDYYSSFPVCTPSNEYSHPFENRETDCSVKKEITHSSSYLVKIEQYSDYYTDNSHFNFTSNNSDNISLNYNLFATNCNILQRLSPRLSYPDQPLLDLGYGDSVHHSFDYFMSESSTASYSLSPPPTLSPELQTIGPSYCDTIEQNNKCNYNYAALNYPSVETEISACCNFSDGFICNPSTTHDFTSEENKNGDSTIEEDTKSLKSAACSVVSSVGDEVVITKKIYPCNFCNRSFARKYDVARHKRIHTGSKPYVCPHCSKGFSRSDARVRHFRTEIACRDGADKLGRHKTQKLNSTTMNKQ